MRKISMKKKTAATLTAGAICLGTAAGAYAYWTNSGTGTGSASTGTNVAITVNQTGSTLANLYPGGPATVLSGDFTNTNASQVYVANVVVSIPTFSSQTDTKKPACTDADFSIVTASVPVGAEVASATHTGSWTGLQVALRDTGANQDNCKSVSLPLAYSSN